MKDHAEAIQQLLTGLWEGLKPGVGALELDARVTAVAQYVAESDLLNYASAQLLTVDSTAGINDEGPAQELAQISTILLTAVNDAGRGIDLLSWLRHAGAVARDKQRAGGGPQDAGMRSLNKAREGILYLLSNLVLLAGNAIVTLAERIRKTCMDLMSSETSAPVARAILAPVRRMLEARI